MKFFWLCSFLYWLLSDSVTAQTVVFDVREATISSVHAALFSKQQTCHAIISAFLARIEAYNPDINAIISLNPYALHDADSLDKSLASGNVTGSLFCIPILIKDNYDVAGMPTTGGCIALTSSIAINDSPLIATFRHAGAIILGKTNLHEFALEGLSVSSLGGQTVNPYDFTRTPGGSSGGAGAAIAASFAVFGTGTDTVNSLRNPASANSLFSFRPTRGLISRTGIMPNSWIQDTAGAIARSLSDLAMALTVMSSLGHDERDNSTSTIPLSLIEKEYKSALITSAKLPDIRIGVLHGFFNYTHSDETDPVNTLMNSTIATLRSSGATLIDIADEATFNATLILATMDVQKYEYRELLTSYLSSSNFTGDHPRSMSDLYLKTSAYLVIPSQYPFINAALSSSTSNESYNDHLQLISNLTQTLMNMFSTHALDAIIYPEQKNLVVPIGSPSQAGRNGILAALTGTPVITIPIGFSNVSDTAPIGIPVGMEILGLPWTEAKLLGIAKRIDDKLHARRMPITGNLGETVEVFSYYNAVPEISPRGLNEEDLKAYPTGTFGL